MDFLDSIDLEPTHRRSHRVRSWYLYEQFKSLERNQLVAAQKLKDESYQKRILRQELSERKARRKLCDQCSLSSSASYVDSIRSGGDRASFTTSYNNFFETFSELQDGVSHVPDARSDDNVSQGSTLNEVLMNERELCNHDDSKITVKDSSDSIVDKVESSHTTPRPVSPNKQVEGTNLVFLAEDINKHLELIKQTFESISIETDQGENQTRNNELVHDFNRDSTGTDHRIANSIWSKLVGFAHSIMQLNNRNCYSDYSSQLLTAVLACDVLKRVISRMCDLLQPYVSPIKFATDEPDVSIDCRTKEKCEKCVQVTKSFKRCEHKQHIKLEPKYRKRNCKCMSYCPQSTPLSSYKGEYKKKYASEPLDSVAELTFMTPSQGSSNDSTIWPEYTKRIEKRVAKKSCAYPCRKMNPMLKIGQYIDSVLGYNDNR